MTQVSLQQMLQTGTLPEKPVQIAILQQIAAQLDQAHARGLVHGNLSPQVILVSGLGAGDEVSVFVKDFGTTFVLDPAVIGGSIPLNAYYLSPEQVLGIDVSPLSDEFSLAAIAYEVLSGRKTFEADQLPGLIFAICSDTPKSIHEIDRSLTPDVSAVFTRALAKDREQRYPGCTDFVAALKEQLIHCEGWSAVKQAEQPVALAAAATQGFQSLPEPEAIQAPPVRAEYELPPLRHRPRWEDEELAPPSSPVKKFAIAGLILLGIAGVWAFFFNGPPKPDIPTQVLDTKIGPVSPPPAEPAQVPAPVRRALPKQPAAAPSAKEAPQRQSTKRVPALPVIRQTGGGLVDVELLSEPPGASITVDGNSTLSCRAPCNISLNAGRHTLTATLSGYTTAQRIFNLPETSTVFVSMPKLSGSLIVTSTPSAATILVDGVDFGLTPATLHLSPGQHRITLLNGSQRHEQLVTVVGDGIQATGYTFAR